MRGMTDIIWNGALSHGYDRSGWFGPGPGDRLAAQSKTRCGRERNHSVHAWNKHGTT